MRVFQRSFIETYFSQQANTFFAMPVALPAGSLRIACSCAAIIRNSPSSVFCVT